MSSCKSELEKLESVLHNTEPRETTIFLDSCGPSLARHYIFLQRVGFERLKTFKQIHAVSGGIFSLVGFWAFSNSQTRQSVDYYVEHFDKDYRKLLHKSPFSKLAFAGKMIIRRPIFEGVPLLENLVDYCFAEELSSLPIQKFPLPFTAYTTQSGTRDLLKIAVGDPNEPTQLTIGQLISEAVRIPSVYGEGTRAGALGDAAFHPDYRKLVRSLEAEGHRLIISTPWKHGSRGQATYINVFSEGDAKMKMFSDFAKLVLNVKNHSFAEDLQLAFRS